MAKSDPDSNGLRQDQPEWCLHEGRQVGGYRSRSTTPVVRPDITELSRLTSDSICAADRRGGILISCGCKRRARTGDKPFEAPLRLFRHHRPDGRVRRRNHTFNGNRWLLLNTVESDRLWELPTMSVPHGCVGAQASQLCTADGGRAVIRREHGVGPDQLRAPVVGPVEGKIRLPGRAGVRRRLTTAAFDRRKNILRREVFPVEGRNQNVELVFDLY